MQPWAAKALLPAFGGSAAVWLTTMLFFQTAVVAGYAYAHGAAERLPWFVHVGLVGVVAAIGTRLLAVDTFAAAPLNVLGSLALGVGLPAVALAATTPLLHAWLVRRQPGREPYALYAASNAGSLVGLFAYPLVVEPFMGLGLQQHLWGGGIATVAVGLVVAQLAGTGESPPAESASEDAEARPGGPLGWFAYAFVPASLLYGFTAYLLRDIAAVPMLWVLPLALYLLTYVLAFARRPRRMPAAFGFVAPVLVFGVALTTVAAQGGAAALLTHIVGFVLLAFHFHSELSRSRPASPGQGTSFYLWVATGGLAAGIFNTLLAPLLFTAPFEYGLTYALALVLIPASYGAKYSLSVRRGLYVVMMLVLGLAFAFAPGAVGPKLTAASVMVLAFGVTLSFPALGNVMLALFLGAIVTYPGASEIVEQRRSFYGTQTVERRILDGVEYRALAMGVTEHGIEPAEGPVVPLGYYHPEGPTAEVFGVLSPRRTAIVGLGVGALALFSRPGDEFRFIELDPIVADLARTQFRSLAAAPGTVSVEIADGRLGLAQMGDASLDMIVVDAFASDAIPIHLLTVEAFDIYARKLAPTGVLLLHTSNRFLDIDRVAVGGLQARGWTARHRRFTPAGDSPIVWPSSWVVAVPPGAELGALSTLSEWQKRSDGVVWTDAHSSLLGTLRH